MPRRADIDINVRANSRAVGELQKGFQATERSAVKGFERIGQAGIKAFRDTERARERAFGRRQRVQGFAQTIKQTETATKRMDLFASSIKRIPKEFESAERRTKRSLTSIEDRLKRAFGTRGGIGGNRGAAPLVRGALTGFDTGVKQIKEQEKALETARLTTNRYSNSFIALRKQVSRTTETVRNFISRGLRGLRNFGSGNLRQLGERFRRFANSVGRSLNRAGGRFRRFVRRTERGVGRISKSMGRISIRFGLIGQAILRILGSVVSGIRSTISTIVGIAAGLGITRAFKAVIDGGKRAELAIVQLGTLFRVTRNEAKDLFFAVREFARPLPVTTDEVVSAFIRLRSVGIQPTSERLKGLINASLALGRPLSNIVLAVQSLETESLRKLGINLDRRGEQAILNFGSRTILLPKDDTKIREGLIDLFNSAFTGALERSLKNFQTNVDVLRSVIGDTSADLGLKFLNPLTKVVQRTTDWLEVNRKIVNLKLGRFFDNVGKAILDLGSVENINFLFEQFFNFIDKIADSPQSVTNFFKSVKNTVSSAINTIRELVAVLKDLLEVGLAIIESGVGTLFGIEVPESIKETRQPPAPRDFLERSATSVFPAQRIIGLLGLGARGLGIKAGILEPPPPLPTTPPAGGADNDFSDSLADVEARRKARRESEKTLDEQLRSTTTLSEIVGRVAKDLNSAELAFLTVGTQADKTANQVKDLASILGTRLDFSRASVPQAQALIDRAVAAQTPEGRSVLVAEAARIAEPLLLTSKRFEEFNQNLKILDFPSSTLGEVFRASRGAQILGLEGKASQKFIESLERVFDSSGRRTLESREPQVAFNRVIRDFFITADRQAAIDSVLGLPPDEQRRILDDRFDPSTSAGREAFAPLEQAYIRTFQQFSGVVPDEDQLKDFRETFQSGVTGTDPRKLIDLVLLVLGNGAKQLEVQGRIQKNTALLRTAFDRGLSRGLRQAFRGDFSKGLRGLFSGIQEGIQDTFATAFSDQLTGDKSIFKNLTDTIAEDIQGVVSQVGTSLGELFDNTLGRIGTKTRTVEETRLVDGKKQTVEVEKNTLSGLGREVLGATLTAIAAGQAGTKEGLFGGGLAGLQLGSQFFGTAGTIASTAAGAAVGLISSLFGGSKQRRVSLRQTGPINIRDLQRNQLSDDISVSTQRFDISGNTIERQFINSLLDFRTAFRDIFLGLPREIFRNIIGGFDAVDIDTSRLNFTTDNKDARTVEKRVNDYITGVTATLAPVYRDALVNALVESGVDREVAQARVDERIARIDSAKETEERVAEGEGLLEDLSVAGQAKAILEGTADGIGLLSSNVLNLSGDLGLGSVSLAGFSESLRSTVAAGEIDQKTLDDYKKLQSDLEQLPAAFQQLISSAVSNITGFSEFLPDDPQRDAFLRNTLFDTLDRNRDLDISDTPEKRLAFLNTERNILNDIVGLERQKHEAEREAAQELKSIYDSVKNLGDSIQASLLSLRTGSDSPLAPAQRVGLVQSQIADIDRQLAGETDELERVRLLERRAGLANQLAGLGSQFGAGSPEQRAVFARGETELESILDNELFQSQSERLANIGDTLEKDFELSEEAQKRIRQFEEDNVELLGDVASYQARLLHELEQIRMNTAPTSTSDSDTAGPTPAGQSNSSVVGPNGATSTNRISIGPQAA